MLIMSTAIGSTFGYILGDIARMMRTIFDQRARQVGLSLAQCRVLALLARHEGINQAGLAELMEVQPISIARLLDRMEATGWVERRADPADRRARRLFLSEKARPLLDQVQILALQSQGEALAGLAEEERELLRQLLLRVHANLSNRLPVGPPPCAPAGELEDLDHECVQ
jgi:DNA-binding MarR family transcriptional regulator